MGMETCEGGGEEREVADRLLLLLWAFAFLLAASRFFRPARDDGLYPQSEPFCKHLEQSGLVLLHFTFAIKQLSHDSLSLTAFGAAAGVSACSGIVSGENCSRLNSKRYVPG